MIRKMRRCLHRHWKKMTGEAKFREIGPTIGTHIGPGAYGIVYVGKTEVGASKEEPQQEEE